MEVDMTIVLEIVSVALLMVTTYLGKYWKDARQVLKEISEAMNATVEALDDDKITPEEATILIKEWRDVMNIVRKIFVK